MEDSPSVDPSWETFKFKLVLLGDASVGKSCLAVRFVRGDFFEYQEPTIGAAFMTATLPVPEKQALVKFEIWDTAGQERYKSLAPMYYRGAAAAVIVYDVTSQQSLDGAKAWIAELGEKEMVLALLGNKVDLGERRVVEAAQVEAFAREKGVLFMETSAKTGQGVQEIFAQIAGHLELQKKKGPDDAVSIQQQSQGSGCCGR